MTLEIQGETVQDLFVEGTRALAELIGTAADGPPGPWVHEVADSTDEKHLLVAWLNTVLERIDVDRILYSEAEIDELTEKQIRVRLRGRPIANKQNEVMEAIVHGVTVTAGPAGCAATVNVLLRH